MNRQFQRGQQGVRSNRYSGSKLTNWTEFHPWHSAIDKVHNRHLSRLCRPSAAPLIVLQRTHAEFVRPLSREDIEDTLSKVSKEYTSDLQGVFVLGGSSKLAKVVDSLYCYGTYWMWCIFLAPFPRAFLRRCYRRPPKPSILSEYSRAGASVRQTRDGLVVEFSEVAIRRFYIRDVLMHEIGHHVDRRWPRSKRKSEGFAEWFATEYGYRMRHDI